MVAVGAPAGTSEVTDCFTCAAAAKFALPAWLASMTQEPAGALNLTRPLAELTVQPDVEEGSTLKSTGLPEAPPVAVTVYVAPTVGLVGGVLVKVMIWEPAFREFTAC